ncbi:MAG: alpha-L-fucosidase [Prevotella sp.]|nr:alpha-L-fucosidase [Prevotella sp.]
MKRFLYTILCISCHYTIMAQTIVPSTMPSVVQQQLIDRGYGMFIHFGPNTFLNIEWGDGSAPASTYAPTALDCDQWVRVAHDAGFRYVLLVTKHHDGFCLWDSHYTDYDVASSPCKTDVVRAVSDACRKYGLQFAVYYSLWDRHEPSYTGRNFAEYIKFMENQLTELLTQYGPVCELWLDGAWDKGVSEWQLPRLYSLVKRLQPDCAMGVNHTIASKSGEELWGWDDCVLPDSCREDNSHYLRFFPVDFRLWDPKIAPLYDAKQYLYKDRSYYMPFEHTICLSKAWNWFQKDQLMPVRELDELEELFYWTTMNQNTLVLDVAPDREGRIREHEANAVIRLGQRLGLRQGQPLPKRTMDQIVSYRAKATANSVWQDQSDYDATHAVDGGMQTRWASEETKATLTLDMGQMRSFDRVVIFEYQDTKVGEDNFTNYRTGRIEQYSIDVLNDKGEWTTIYLGDEPLGDCKVIRLPHTYTSRQVRLQVRKASAPPSIWEILFINSQSN